MTLRIWSEFLPFERLAEPDLLKGLARYGLRLCLAIPPQAEQRSEGLRRALEACAASGVSVDWWVLLEEADGYWPCEANLTAYAQRVQTLRAWAHQHGLPFETLAVDFSCPCPRCRRFERHTGLASCRWCGRSCGKISSVSDTGRRCRRALGWPSSSTPMA